jgi:hypothetical protein
MVGQEIAANTGLLAQLTILVTSGSSLYNKTKFLTLIFLACVQNIIKKAIHELK